jgi:enoyl-CoA hydratase/carnithine racemase
MYFSSLPLVVVAFAFLSTICALDLPKYTGLKTSLNHSVLQVTFHNPNSAINLWNQNTTDEMTDLVRRLQQDNETKVIIFQSDVPRYFMAHIDLSMPDLGT